MNTDDVLAQTDEQIPLIDRERTQPHSKSLKKDLQLRIEGRVVSAVPIGYTLRWGSRGRSVTVDKRRAKMVVRAFALVAERKPLREIVRIMQQEGLKGRNGKPISKTSLCEFLRNPFYTGFMRYRGRLYPGNFSPLISSELFKRAQSELNARRSAKHKKTAGF